MGATANGERLLLLRWNVRNQAYITRFDGRSGKFEEPHRLTLDTNSNLAFAWTPDSKSVIFVSNRNGRWRLFRQDINGSTPELLEEGPSLRLPRLSADGLQIIYSSTASFDNQSLPVSLMGKPLKGGPAHVILQAKGIINHQCAVAPFTQCVFSQIDGSNQIFSTFDLMHGAGRELFREPGDADWSLSPDGSKLAVFGPHQIRFISVATGAASNVTIKDWPLSNGDWAASGKSVLMKSRTPDGSPVILEIDRSGVANIVLKGNANDQFTWMVQSPDGRYGLLGEIVQSEGNAWIVDHFQRY